MFFLSEACRKSLLTVTGGSRVGKIHSPTDAWSKVSKVQPKEGLWKEVDDKLTKEAPSWEGKQSELSLRLVLTISCRLRGLSVLLHVLVPGAYATHRRRMRRTMWRPQLSRRPSRQDVTFPSHPFGRPPPQLPRASSTAGSTPKFHSSCSYEGEMIKEPETSKKRFGSSVRRSINLRHCSEFPEAQPPRSVPLAMTKSESGSEPNVLNASGSVSLPQTAT